MLFRSNTSLGKISSDFIPGRGYIVGRGKVRKLQIALPPENRNQTEPDLGRVGAAR